MKATLGGGLRGLLFALMLVGGTAAFLAFALALNGYQLTQEGTARRLLERSLAALTDLDAALPALQDALREQAQQEQGEAIVVPDFPLPVSVSREEAVSLEGQALRQRLLTDGSRVLYRQGTSALLSDPEARRRLESTSMPWALEKGLDLITQDTHRRLLIAMVALGIVAGLLLLPPLVMVPNLWGKLALLGGVLLVASLPSLAAALGARFFLRAAQGDADPFVHQLLQVGVDAMTIPVRNYLALSALGSGLLLVAAAMVWAAPRRGVTALTGEEDAA
ncbi:MAG TPA: hypothetical protein VNL95_03915 [Dehalococcoidia bacterium]|nr:hypothetical protein [Dehalococcoidia bacterium]